MSARLLGVTKNKKKEMKKQIMKKNSDLTLALQLRRKYGKITKLEKAILDYLECEHYEEPDYYKKIRTDLHQKYVENPERTAMDVLDDLLEILFFEWRDRTRKKM